MYPSDPLRDPVVEILRLAYRRGLAIQREQEEKSKEIHAPSSQEHVLIKEQDAGQPVVQKDNSHEYIGPPPVEVGKLGQEEGTEQH